MDVNSMRWSEELCGWLLLGSTGQSADRKMLEKSVRSDAVLTPECLEFVMNSKRYGVNLALSVTCTICPTHLISLKIETDGPFPPTLLTDS